MKAKFLTNDVLNFSYFKLNEFQNVIEINNVVSENSLLFYAYS